MDDDFQPYTGVAADDWMLPSSTSSVGQFDPNAYPDFGQFAAQPDAPPSDAAGAPAAFSTPDQVGGSPVDVGGQDVLGAPGGDSAVAVAGATVGAGFSNDGGAFTPSINPGSTTDGGADVDLESLRAGPGMGAEQAVPFPQSKPGQGGASSLLGAALGGFGSATNSVKSVFRGAGSIDSRGGTANVKTAGFSDYLSGQYNKWFGSGSPAARAPSSVKKSGAPANLVLLAGAGFLIFAMLKHKR